MAGSVNSVNDLNFDQEVLESDLPVLVDFSATWCGPCKQIAPLVEQLAGEYEGLSKVPKIDVDESAGTAAKYGIRGVLTLYVFKGGQIVSQHVGAAPKSALSDLIEKAL